MEKNCTHIPVFRFMFRMYIDFSIFSLPARYDVCFIICSLCTMKDRLMRYSFSTLIPFTNSVMSYLCAQTCDQLQIQHLQREDFSFHCRSGND